MRSATLLLFAATGLTALSGDQHGPASPAAEHYSLPAPSTPPLIHREADKDRLSPGSAPAPASNFAARTDESRSNSHSDDPKNHARRGVSGSGGSGSGGGGSGGGGGRGGSSGSGGRGGSSSGGKGGSSSGRKGSSTSGDDDADTGDESGAASSGPNVVLATAVVAMVYALI